MSWKLTRILSLACAFALVTAIQANASVQVGSYIKFQNGPGDGGGEFGVALTSSPSQTEFITFCVEKNEFINYSSSYYVESIEKFAVNGGLGGATGGKDYVDARTAWLYYNFREGTLAGYDFGDVTDANTGTRRSSANALQNAVWFLETEQASAGVGQGYVDLANAEYNAYLASLNNGPAYNGNMADAIGNVRIMNIRKDSPTGDFAQSQLFIIPEPGTIAIWSSLAMVGLVAGRRRRKNS